MLQQVYAVCSVNEKNGFLVVKQGERSMQIGSLGKKISKGGEVLKLDNMSPLLDFHDDVVIFMGAGDIQTYEYSFERLLSSLTHSVQ